MEPLARERQGLAEVVQEGADPGAGLLAVLAAQLAGRARGAVARVRVGGRAVVLTLSTLLCGPLVKLGTGLLVNAQLVAAGKPEVQDNDTLLGNAPTGVTVTV